MRGEPRPAGGPRPGAPTRGGSRYPSPIRSGDPPGWGDARDAHRGGASAAGVGVRSGAVQPKTVTRDEDELRDRVARCQGGVRGGFSPNDGLPARRRLGGHRRRNGVGPMLAPSLPYAGPSAAPPSRSPGLRPIGHRDLAHGGRGRGFLAEFSSDGLPELSELVCFHPARLPGDEPTLDVHDARRAQTGEDLRDRPLGQPETLHHPALRGFQASRCRRADAAQGV